MNILILTCGFYCGQIVFAYLMLLITFPIGILFLFIMTILELLFNYLNIDIFSHNSEVAILVIQWIMMFLIGYFQWFILIPKIISYFKKRNEK